MWEVIGYIVGKNQDGEVTSYTLHCKRPVKELEGAGDKTRSAWYRPHLGYKPVIGDKIVIEEEKRGQYMVITDIIVM